MYVGPEMKKHRTEHETNLTNLKNLRTRIELEHEKNTFIPDLKDFIPSTILFRSQTNYILSCAIELGSLTVTIARYWTYKFS